MVTFAAYRDYQQLTGYDDATSLWSLSAPHETPPVANYEDRLYDVLRAWLHVVTGVDWYRAFEHAPRPIGQYCTIHMLRAEALPDAPYIARNFVPGSRDYAESASAALLYTFQLDVYRDAGSLTRSELDPTPITQSPHGSAPDVLMRLLAASELGIHRRALAEYCIALRRIGPVINGPPVERHERFEWRATADLQLIAAPMATRRVPTSGCVDLNLCDEDPATLCHDTPSGGVCT